MTRWVVYNPPRERFMSKRLIVVPVLVACAISVASAAGGQAPGSGLRAPQEPGDTGFGGDGQAVLKSPPDTVATEIPGVIAAGTKIHLIRDLFDSTEGAIAMPDGSLLFTEQDAGDGRLVRIDKDDNISVYAVNTNRTIGLAYDPKGRLIAAQSRIGRVGVITPTRDILADQFEGVPL